LKEDPNIISVNYHLALSFLGIGDDDLAIKYFSKVVDLDPEHQDAVRRLKELTDPEDLYTFEVPPL